MHEAEPAYARERPSSLSTRTSKECAPALQEIEAADSRERTAFGCGLARIIATQAPRPSPDISQTDKATRHRSCPRTSAVSHSTDQRCFDQSKLDAPIRVSAGRIAQGDNPSRITELMGSTTLTTAGAPCPRISSGTLQRGMEAVDSSSLNPLPLT